MSPAADFVCNSKKCRTKKGAPVYELPVKATHCPMGHRQIVRLFNKVNVNTGRADDRMDFRHTSSRHATRTDALVDAPVSAALSKRDEMAIAARRYPMVKAVPMRNLPQALGALYGTQAPPVQMSGTDLNETRSAEGQPARPARPESFKPARPAPAAEVLSTAGAGSRPPTRVEHAVKDFKVRVVRNQDGSLKDVQGEKAG